MKRQHELFSLLYMIYNFVLQLLQNSDRANMSGCHRYSFIVTMTASRNLRQSPPWVNRSIHFNFWRCNSVFLHVESIFKIKEIRDEYLFHHWNSKTWMPFWPFTAYISYKLQTGKNHNQQSVPFSYTWVVNTAFLLEIESKLFIPHQSLSFFLRERWIPLSLVQPHTHTENCVRTNIISYNGFFLSKDKILKETYEK